MFTEDTFRTFTVFILFRGRIISRSSLIANLARNDSRVTDGQGRDLREATSLLGHKDWEMWVNNMEYA